MARFNARIDPLEALRPPPAIGALLKLPLPDAFRPGSTAPITANDLLGLPVAFATSGLGDSAQPAAFDSTFARHVQRFRFYGQDTWRVRPGLTLKYGLRSFMKTVWNHEFQKWSPFANTPLYGTAANPREKNNFAPAVGFAWNVKNGGTTVIRSGFSIAYDRAFTSTV